MEIDQECDFSQPQIRLLCGFPSTTFPRKALRARRKSSFHLKSVLSNRYCLSKSGIHLSPIFCSASLLFRPKIYLSEKKDEEEEEEEEEEEAEEEEEEEEEGTDPI